MIRFHSKIDENGYPTYNKGHTCNISTNLRVRSPRELSKRPAGDDFPFGVPEAIVVSARRENEMKSHKTYQIYWMQNQMTLHGREQTQISVVVYPRTIDRFA